jgi:excisionase family DNA binding protein
MGMAETVKTTAMQRESEPLMLRTEEAARLSGLGRSKFLEMAYRGEIPGMSRFDRTLRFNRRLLEAWLDERSSAGSRQST